MTRLHLSFLDTRIRFELAPDAMPAFAGVRRFFRHLLRPDGDDDGPATFVVRVDTYRPERDVPAVVWSVEPSVIRRSTAPEFTFDAHVVDAPDGRRRYVNRTTWLEAPRDARTDPVFRLRITPGSTIQVLDFVRDLVIRNQEALGTVVWHAAGVTDGHRAVVIAGRKGAGKTTTLLSLLRRDGWSYFTGDKLFVRPRVDGVDVFPWRDYPYLGVGTIRADPALATRVRRLVGPSLDSRPPTDKLLLDPDEFESWLGGGFSAQPRRLAAILLPQVRPGRPLRHWPVTDPNQRWAQLNTIVDRQADTSFFGWQSHLVPDYTQFFAALAELPPRLTGVPMIRLEGTLDVDPDALLAEHGAGVRS